MQADFNKCKQNLNSAVLRNFSNAAFAANRAARRDMGGLMRLYALFAGAALALGVVSAASASQLIITTVGTGNGDLGNVAVPGQGNPWTTPILMTDSTGKVHVVFCDDLQHDVNVGGGQNLTYNTGSVTVDGAGNPLSQSVSNRMGHLAEIGIWNYKHGNEDGAIAAQAAIWALEYNFVTTSSGGLVTSLVTSTDAKISKDIALDVNIAVDGTSYATGIISASGTQNQITGGVPEPATWAMMLVGVGLLGVALRFHRKQDARLETLRREVASAARA